ncbi:MAG: hypothetical protein ACR2LS_10180 [Thermomicrobiales bacterium]
MTKDSDKHSRAEKRSLPLGNTLASGIILVGWGVLFSFFPDYANLWPAPSLFFQIVSIVCYILGGLVAISGFNELTTNPLHRGASFTIGFGAVATILHIASVDATVGSVSLLLKTLVLLALVIGLMVVGMELPRSLNKSVGEMSHDATSEMITPQDSTTGKSRTHKGLEISVNLLVALVGLLGAAIQLVNTLLGN